MENLNKVKSHLLKLGFKSTTNSNTFKIGKENNNISIFKASNGNLVLYTASTTVQGILGMSNNSTSIENFIKYQIKDKAVTTTNSEHKEEEAAKEVLTPCDFSTKAGLRAFNYICSKLGLENPNEKQKINILNLLNRLEVQAIAKRELITKDKVYTFNYIESKFLDFGYFASIEKGYAVVRTNYNKETKQKEIIKRQSLQDNLKPSLIGLNQIPSNAKAIIIVEGLNDCIAGNLLLNTKGIYFISSSLAKVTPSISLLNQLKKIAPKAKFLSLGDNDEAGQFLNKIMSSFDFKPLLWDNLKECSICLKYGLEIKNKLDICDVVYHINKNLQNLSKDEKLVIISDFINWILK